MTKDNFKEWFKIMWGNGYIFIFLISITIVISQLFALSEVINLIKESWHDGITAFSFTVAGFTIPSVILVLVAYKGFYKHWKNLKKNNNV